MKAAVSRGIVTFVQDRPKGDHERQRVIPKEQQAAVELSVDLTGCTQLKFLGTNCTIFP